MSSSSSVQEWGKIESLGTAPLKDTWVWGTDSRIAQSVQRLATGWTVRGSKPVWAEFSAPLQTGPGAHPASAQWVPGVFPGRGVNHLPPSPAPRLNKE